MKTQWLPAKGDCVVLDTNVLSYAKRKPYGIACSALLATLEKRGVKLVLPQIVEYEFLRHALSYEDYEEMRQWMAAKFERWPMSEGIVSAATLMQILLHAHDATRAYAERKDTLADMLVAATTGKHQIEQQCTTYLLSGDADFPLPYIEPIARYDLQHRKEGGRMQYLHFYEVDVTLVNEDWKRFRHE
jgi:predicted nucleic acid-binding protein